MKYNTYMRIKGHYLKKCSRKGLIYIADMSELEMSDFEKLLQKPFSERDKDLYKTKAERDKYLKQIIKTYAAVALLCRRELDKRAAKRMREILK